MPVWLIPLLKAMGVGAALGGGTAAVTGGDVKEGALMGAAGGGIGSGFSGLLGGASGAATAAGSGAGEAGADSAGMAALGLGKNAVQATGAATSTASNPTSWSNLFKKALIESGTNAAVGAATPQYGMSQPGSLPQMNQQDDTMAQLNALMQRRGGII